MTIDVIVYGTHRVTKVCFTGSGSSGRPLSVTSRPKRTVPETVEAVYQGFQDDS